MIVGVSMRMVEATAYLEPRDALSHDLLRFLSGLGCTPLLIPNSIDPDLYINGFRYDRLILGGGDDIASDISGPVAQIANQRDRTERRLLDAATARAIPVLGICRGAMFLNLYLGGDLTQDVEHVSAEKHVAHPHPIVLWDGRTTTTNSYHRHGILSGQLAPGLRQLAITAGGVIEAFRSDDHGLLGLIWHPERPGSASVIDQELIGEWLD